MKKKGRALRRPSSSLRLPSRCSCLERQLQRKLNVARRTGRSDLAVAAVVDIGVGHDLRGQRIKAEVRPVESIEEIGLEAQLPVFLNVELLAHGDVPEIKAGAAHYTRKAVAEARIGRLSKSSGIEPVVGSAIADVDVTTDVVGAPPAQG